MIRIGKLTCESFKIDNFTTVIIPDDLKPYYLKDNDGVIFENRWEFSKVYEKVYDITQKVNGKVIWSHPKETHITNGEINDKYIKWREKGFKCEYAIKHPNGREHDNECLYTINSLCNREKLNYIDARKKFYLPEYCKLIKKQKSFKELKRRINRGENLLLLSDKGICPIDLGYYIGKYNVKKDLFYKNTIIVNKETVSIMLNDDKNTFSYDFCLAMALHSKDNIWCQDYCRPPADKLPERVKTKHKFSMSFKDPLKGQKIKKPTVRKLKKKTGIIKNLNFDLKKEFDKMIKTDK